MSKFKENIKFKMIDIFLSSSNIFAQDAATKLIVIIQKIKKQLNENTSRKFEDLSKDLKSNLTILSAHIVYMQETALIVSKFTKPYIPIPFIKGITVNELNCLSVEELFEFYDEFCQNIDVDSYNLQVKEIISLMPPNKSN